MLGFVSYSLAAGRAVVNAQAEPGCSVRRSESTAEHRSTGFAHEHELPTSLKLKPLSFCNWSVRLRVLFCPQGAWLWCDSYGGHHGQPDGHTGLQQIHRTGGPGGLAIEHGWYHDNHDGKCCWSATLQPLQLLCWFYLLGIERSLASFMRESKPIGQTSRGPQL